MNNKDINKKNKGEMGLSILITLLSNNFWKRVKVGIFDFIKKNPHKFVEEKRPFSEEEKLDLDQYFSIEIICETVSYAELLGAYLLAFSKKDPVVQKTLLNYKTNEVTALFETIEKRNIEEIAKIIGYPSLSEFGPNLEKQKEILEDYKKSLINVRQELKKIAKFYLEHRVFYNDYKHGFRIFPSVSNPPNSTPFGVTIQLKKSKVFNQVVMYPKEFLDKKAEEALKVSDRISQILDVLTHIFKERFIENKKLFH